MREASYNGHTATAKMLIKKGADINAKDTNGNTLLHLASLNGHPTTANLLIEQGADINAKDIDGKTPFDLEKINK